MIPNCYLSLNVPSELSSCCILYINDRDRTVLFPFHCGCIKALVFPHTWDSYHCHHVFLGVCPVSALTCYSHSLKLLAGIFLLPFSFQVTQGFTIRFIFYSPPPNCTLLLTLVPVDNSLIVYPLAV